MAWTAPRTWTTGELVTAALLNTHVRDNLLALGVYPLGTAGQVFKVNSAATGTEWATASAPACRVRSLVSATIATATPTYLGWTAEEFDTDTMHDNATNNSRITATTAGIYLVLFSARLQYHLTTPFDWTVYVYLNRTTVQAQRTGAPPAGSVEIPVDLACLVNMAANDYVEVQVTQSSGSNKGITTSNPSTPQFSAVRVG